MIELTPQQYDEIAEKIKDGEIFEEISATYDITFEDIRAIAKETKL